MSHCMIRAVNYNRFICLLLQDSITIKVSLRVIFRLTCPRGERGIMFISLVLTLG